MVSGGAYGKSQAHAPGRIEDCGWDLEVADARLPLSSRNPDLRELSPKPRFSAGKIDLADAAATEKWVNYWAARGGETIISADLIKGTGLRELRSAVRDRFAHLKRPARLVVVGIPNVGKSTLINRLTGGRRAAQVGGLSPGGDQGGQAVAQRAEHAAFRQPPRPVMAQV